ncbi:DUF6476 family protein [uncultured Litoreibacter sp.]|uniref:DUF6476 family protein n=1 Tax=uncultured Litoreibacter sp. TaxID=1392394 RepID=UPI00261FDCC0|nr:DUF6476 family protein [uncultured Litoreibacter sp.]
MTVSDINDPEGGQPEPANLKFLRRLVTTLTAVMIGGLLVLIALIVIRVQQPATTLAIPQQINLPGGAVATAFTTTPDWYAVVTQNNQILIFDRITSELIQTITVE